MKNALKFRVSSIVFVIFLVGTISGMIFHQHALVEDQVTLIDDFKINNPTVSDAEDYYGMYMSSFLGGYGLDYGYAVAIDENTGAIFVVGYTSSTNFLTINAIDSSLSGSYDGFVVKYNFDGTVNFSTYLGGASDDYAKDIEIDANGDCYITGYTQSSDFPTLNAYDSSINGYADTFITKLDSNGALIFSTFLGGTDQDYGKDIALHEDGSYYVTGQTYSTDFPTYNAYDALKSGAVDIFVTKFNSDNTLNLSTYFGGDNYDIPNEICVDHAKNIYLAAKTNSNFLATPDAADELYNGNYDGLVVRFDMNGTLNYSTYIGDYLSDECSSIEVDDSGAFYVAGKRSYGTYTTRDQVLAAKYNPDGTLEYKTYFGGTYNDYGMDLVIDEHGNCYITGTTESSNFPTVHAFDDELNSGGLYTEDAFICQLDFNGEIVFSSYIGGSSNDYGCKIAIDSNSTIYLTGYTYSYNFPTVNAMDYSRSGSVDAYVMKLESPMMDNDLDGLPNYWEYEMGLEMWNASDAALDFDGDFLNNTEEYFYGTHPWEHDTDNDGLIDGDEVLIHFTDPTDPDTDDDSMHDGWEQQMGLNATDDSDRNEDKDLDGLPNYWEFIMLLNATDPTDCALDGDADNLNNTAEFQYGCSAIDPDSDNDLLEDGAEVHIYGTNPTRKDSDYDDLEDGQEVNSYGTNPLVKDTDGDQMDDGYEIECYLDPLDPSDTTLDRDQDGLPNLYEFLLGLDANYAGDANHDLDRDGMPNLWEYENGFNPDYNYDAHLDADDDNLSNRDEYDIGTDPHNPDTDGDGVIDGNDNDPHSYMRPTGNLIVLFSLLGIAVFTSATVLVGKYIIRRRTKYKKTYFNCPRCSMKNLRANGICIYCGEEIDKSKIDSMVKQLEKSPISKSKIGYCDKCGRSTKNGICPNCGRSGL